MATLAGGRAFREAYVNAEPGQDIDINDWGSVDARRMRYDMLWAFVQGNPYSQTVHAWSKGMQATYGMYKYSRAIYNPAYEIASFYKSTVWGGTLDMEAGDGKSKPSALPIIIPADNASNDQALRSAISAIWRMSNWKAARSIVPYHGAAMGDVAIQVIDDTERGAVYLKPIHPGSILEVDLDPFGNVKGYTLEYERLDPDQNLGGKKTAVYSEVVTRGEDETVYFNLYKDGNAYSWGEVDENGNPVYEWSVPYGFIPLVFVPNNQFGRTWGMAESFPKMSVFREIDDQGSKLNDQIRKMVEGAWLLAGVQNPSDVSKSQPSSTGAAATTSNPEPGRQEMPVFYAKDPGASATSLVSNLSIADTVANIVNMQESLERSFPELALNRSRTGNLAAETVRLLQRDVESKVIAYREIYDDALVRAQQMAIAIGGYRGYAGFDGFNLDSYANGDLAHSIGERPVFTADPVDTADLEGKRLDNANKARTAGWSLPVYLESQGVEEATIEALIQSPEYQAQVELLGLNSGMGTVE